MFNITAGTVTIQDVTITQGTISSGRGAGVLVNGATADVTLSNVVVTSNTTTGGADGA